MNAFPIFNFGDQSDIAAAQPLQQLPDGVDVCGAAHEGHGDVVKIVFYGKFEIAAVPGGEAWQGHVHAGHIDAFVVAQHAAGNYAAKNV